MSAATTITASDLLPRIVVPSVTLVALYMGVWQHIASLVLTEVISELKHVKYTACRAATPGDNYLGALVGHEGAFLLVGV
jgi:hypothetical protein